MWWLKVAYESNVSLSLEFVELIITSGTYTVCDSMPCIMRPAMSGGIWPGGKNCSRVWLFWCSVICSASQRATVQRESELGVRGPE